MKLCLCQKFCINWIGNYTDFVCGHRQLCLGYVCVLMYLAKQQTRNSWISLTSKQTNGISQHVHFTYSSLQSAFAVRIIPYIYLISFCHFAGGRNSLYASNAHAHHTRIVLSKAVPHSTGLRLRQLHPVCASRPSERTRIVQSNCYAQHTRQSRSLLWRRLLRVFNCTDTAATRFLCH